MIDPSDIPMNPPAWMRRQLAREEGRRAGRAGLPDMSPHRPDPRGDWERGHQEGTNERHHMAPMNKDAVRWRLLHEQARMEARRLGDLLEREREKTLQLRRVLVTIETWPTDWTAEVDENMEVLRSIAQQAVGNG